MASSRQPEAFEPVLPGNFGSVPPYSIDQSGVGDVDEALWPVIVTDPDGIEWVQMVDVYGHFAGFDPTPEQIAQAVAATTTPANEQHQPARIARLAVTTAGKHTELAYLGLQEIALDLPEQAAVLDAFMWDQDLWCKTLRTTEDVAPGMVAKITDEAEEQ